MTNRLEQAINCEDGGRAGKIIQDALGIENTGFLPKTWPADREQRGRIMGEWLQAEIRLVVDRCSSEMAGGKHLRTKVPDDHQPCCFALEEERGENWRGSGAATSAIKEAKPSL